MQRTTNLNLPIIPANEYTTVRVVDMIEANQGTGPTSAFNVIDAAIASKQAKITINPSGTPTEVMTKIEVDGTIYEAAGSAISVDSALSTTSTNPVENRVITNELYHLSDISTDLGVYASAISGDTALDIHAMSIGSNYYNFRDSRVIGLFTEGYVALTPIADGDTVVDDDLIDAYTRHMPITVNGQLLGYQTSSGSVVRYLGATMNGADIRLMVFEFNTSTNVVSIHVADVVTAATVASMISTALANAS